LTVNGKDLQLNLTNNSGGLVTIDAMHIVWNVGDTTSLLNLTLDGLLIGNPSTTTSPSDFPSPISFSGPANGPDIESDGTNTEMFVINFQDDIEAGGYTVQLHFNNIVCQISASIP
ncbi:MAG TPA: hypothetical protein VFI68_14155, partial [Anaerolineales bacterium]|nr:hypothetical protein [Anaerolineales bacterium]